MIPAPNPFTRFSRVANTHGYQPSVTNFIRGYPWIRVFLSSLIVVVATDVSWLCNLLLKLTLQRTTPTIYFENLGAVLLTINHAMHSKTKYFALNVHYIRDSSKNNYIIIIYSFVIKSSMFSLKPYLSPLLFLFMINFVFLL